jgi:tetratricopeptide (TPR) repeat protein
VIGREFTRRLVARLAEARERAGDLLRELASLELIFERQLYPELAYMFKHALTQDVAYASLLVQRRKELHGLIGLAIEELYADRLAEHYEVLAHHFSLAEQWERALHYLVKAAEKAVAAFGLREALDLYAQALEAARRQGDGVAASVVMDIHRVRADLFFGIGEFDQSRAEAEVLVELARRIGDRTAEAGALGQIAIAQQWAENFPEALTRAREAIEIAEPLGAQAALAGALYVRGYVHGVSGQLVEAEADYGRALAIGRAVGDAARQALSLHLLALHRSWQGRYREGLELGEEGIQIAREHRLVIPLLRCLWNEGLGRHELGEYDAALAAFGEGLVLAEKIGDDAYLARFLNTLGWVRIDCGDFAHGVELSERSYEVTNRSKRAGHGTGAERRAFIRNNEADALMAQGNLAGAGEALEESLHIVQHPPPSRWMTWRYTTHCYASLGQLALLRGDAAQARRMADQSLELSTLTSSRKYESWAWRVKGGSATAFHAWDEAEDALRRAHEIAEAIRQPRSTWLSRVALGRLAAARGRRDEALGHYRAARTLIAALRAGVQDPGLRRGLETSPLILEVEDLVGPE